MVANGRFFGLQTLGLLFFASAIAGCSGASAATVPPLEPVSGVVLIDGEPATGVSVVLLPRDGTKGQGAFGVTDLGGTFTLKHPSGGTGCPKGSYVAIFSKMQTPDGEPIPEGKTAMDVGARDVIHPRYKKQDSLLHVVAVKEGGTSELSFKLKSK